MKLFIILLFCTLLFIAKAQQIQFPREAIEFTIDSVHFTVDGFYYFKNTIDKAFIVPISYPFPNSSSVVDSSWVYNCISLNNVPFYTGKNDLSFVIYVLPKDSPVIRIGYRERHNGHIARYILTTTKYWNRPLLEASYSLFVPPYITITRFSYKPDTSIINNNGTLYLFRKKNFMPIIDFEIAFTMK